MRASVISLLLLCVPSCQEPQNTPGDLGVEQIRLGETLLFESGVYGSGQRVSVYLPEGYEHGNGRFPVLYATHSRFPHLAGTVADLSGIQIPPSILVYLETYDSGDLIPTPIPSRPGSGQADRLLGFLSDELIPLIDDRYRTQPFRIFHSGSWGGVFCLHSLLTRPEVFQGCIAATPWVIYDGEVQHLVRSTGGLLREASFRNNFLFIALGNDPDPGLREGVEALVDTVTSVGAEGLIFEYRFLPGEDHFSIGHKALFDGLRWVFGDWAEIPRDVLERGSQEVEAYLVEMEERFGFPIGAHWGGPYARGFELLGRGDPGAAQEMFSICSNLATVPACFTGLGRAYESAGDIPKAAEAYQQALELATEQGYADLGRFRDAVERVSGGGS